MICIESFRNKYEMKRGGILEDILKLLEINSVHALKALSLSCSYGMGYWLLVYFIGQLTRKIDFIFTLNKILPKIKCDDN